MKNKVLRYSKIALWTLVTLTQPHLVRACFFAYRTIDVGRSFSVRVTDRGHPVKGLRLILSGRQQHAVYAFTDAEGRVNFSNLDAGSFTLEADHDAGIADVIIVKASAGGPENITVPLTWPNEPPVSVKSAEGIIRGPDYYPSGQQTPLSLTLLDALSQHVVANTQSDARGRFAFAGQVPAGTYFLRLNPSALRGWSGEQIQGEIPIAIDYEAKDPALNLDLGESSCGLMYAERKTLPEIQSTEICGSISDVEGAAISNAQIFLLATADERRIIEQTKNGIDGRFTLQERREGAYELLIKSAGFEPYLRAAKIQRDKATDSCTQPIEVQLELLH